MIHNFPINFESPITSGVTVALIPVDRFSRREVRTGVTAAWWDTVKGRALPYRMIRSRSGYLVLVDQPRDASYTFRVDATAAGYLGPVEISVDLEVDEMRRVVLLDRAPAFGFDPEETLIRGTVASADSGIMAGIRSATTPGLAGVTVSADDGRFQTTTDARGAFALALEVPTPAAGEQSEPWETQLTFAHPNHESRPLSVTVTESQTHIFCEPVEIDGSNQPRFNDPDHAVQCGQ